MIGISIGVAVASGATITADALLARADAAMYEAKHAGKGRVEIFGRDLDVRLTDRRELGNDLRFAVERGELELWYRPVASLDTGGIASLEGTVRWNHPTRGLLEPDDVHPDRVRDRRDRADRRVGAHDRRDRHDRVAP